MPSIIDNLGRIGGKQPGGAHASVRAVTVFSMLANESFDDQIASFAGRASTQSVTQTIYKHIQT